MAQTGCREGVGHVGVRVGKVAVNHVTHPRLWSEEVGSVRERSEISKMADTTAGGGRHVVFHGVPSTTLTSYYCQEQLCTTLQAQKAAETAQEAQRKHIMQLFHLISSVEVGCISRQQAALITLPPTWICPRPHRVPVYLQLVPALA
ncbi:hypothetical protein Bbelb_233630 [Branchiostoma belcheri]|nr:hypothetical protein Bbelb_233630 [Branchiostoma belcheri]